MTAAEVATPAPAEIMPITAAPGQLSATLLRLWMALDSRDWSVERVDARLYAIVHGWDGDPDEPDSDPDAAWHEVAKKHGWTPALLVELRAAHEDFKRL